MIIAGFSLVKIPLLEYLYSLAVTSKALVQVLGEQAWEHAGAWKTWINQKFADHGLQPGSGWDTY